MDKRKQIQAAKAVEPTEALGSRVRRLRRAAGLTLKELSARCGLAFSTIAKVETSQISPTYESIMRLANGLEVEVTELFVSSSTQMISGRRAWTPSGEGAKHLSPQYGYQMLCSEMTGKKFIPLLTTIRARSISEFPRLLRHPGEEFIFVISGMLELHTEHHSPLRLSPGDSCYFDSTMGHACLSVGKRDAVILWVCSSVDLPLEAEAPQLAVARWLRNGAEVSPHSKPPNGFAKTRSRSAAGGKRFSGPERREIRNERKRAE